MGRIGTEPVDLVSDLINHETGQSDEERIRHTFFAPDADATLSIPLTNTSADDISAWVFERLGIYSVRTAYHALGPVW